jgi:hypothetical protein
MVAIKSAVLALVASASLVSATCKYSTSGHWWDVVFWTGTECTGSHHEEFYGAAPSVNCDCYNLDSTMNDKVKSFVFTANDASIIIYQDANCKGNDLGMSDNLHGI